MLLLLLFNNQWNSPCNKLECFILRVELLLSWVREPLTAVTLKPACALGREST